MSYELIKDINYSNTPNNKNSQGRKLCPITMDVLNIDNAIMLEEVIYSAKGLVEWVRQELKSAKNMIMIESIIPFIIYSENNNRIFLDNMLYSEFASLFLIRSPITNLPWSIKTNIEIYDRFIRKGRRKYNNVAEFMGI